MRELIPVLQPASTKPLVLRQIPIWEKGVATGFVDLRLGARLIYRTDAPSEMVELPASVSEREKEARFHMLEQLADHDDELMEQLLSDMPPPRDKVFQDLTQEFRDGLICPVLLGSARDNHGIFRLLKALRHETPTVQVTARRLKLENAKSAAYVMKSLHTAHGGKLSLIRVLTGEFGDGTVVTGADGRDERAAGVFHLRGEEPVKRSAAKAGDTVALGRLDSVRSGETVGAEKGGAVQAKGPPPPPPVFAIGLGLKDRKDEVKLTSALAKLIEEDPSLRVEMNADTHQMLLFGQGEMHLRVSIERLQRKYGVAVERRGAAGALQGDDPRRNAGARPPQEAVGRPRPVRRRGARHPAARARRGLRVRREDHRWRRSAPVHPVGGDRRQRLPAARAARLPGGRCRGDAARRLRTTRSTAPTWLSGRRRVLP